MTRIKTGELLGKTARLLNNNLSLKLTQSQTNITAEQWIILQIILDGPKSQKQLGEITLKNKSSINSLISKLLKANYITKVISISDKRTNIISITKSGILARKQAQTITNQTIGEATLNLTNIEIEQLNKLLQRINNNLLKHKV